MDIKFLVEVKETYRLRPGGDWWVILKDVLQSNMATRKEIVAIIDDNAAAGQAYQSILASCRNDAEIKLYTLVRGWLE